MNAHHKRTEGHGLYEVTLNSFKINPDSTKRDLQVHVLPEFRDLVTPLSTDELQGLKAALAKDGQREPLVIGWLNNEYVLLDGHTRYRIGLDRTDGYSRGDLSYKIITLQSREAAKLWILENQVSRRNLTDDQRAVIWNEIRERRSAKQRAEQLQLARDTKAGVQTVGDKTTHTEPKERIRSAVAKDAKLPERKLRDAQELKKAAPELAAKVRTGELTLKEAKRAAATHNAKPKKELNADGRYRKLHSAVLSIYSKLPVKERQEEIRQHATQIIEDCC